MITVYPIGTKVVFGGDSRIEGFVQKIIVTENNVVDYEVVYWNDRVRIAITVSAEEVKADYKIPPYEIGFHALKG